MAKLGISTGIVPDDGTGDSLLDGAVKINSNFDDIYTYFGDGTNLTFTGGVSSQWVTTGVGIHTLSNVGIGTTNPRFKLEVGAVGASGTTLFINGDARVTGIVTIGPASITLNGITNIINVGTGITINGSTGIISATAIVLGGTTLTGAAVTFITAGSGISVDQSTGNVTISATGGGGSSQFVTTSAGIHTLSNVGIGTTNPTSALTVTGNAKIIGVVTATSFVGDGSGLTGVVGSGSGVIVKDSGSLVGTAGTIDFGDNLTVSPISAGVVTVTGSASGGGSSQWVTTAAGIHTLSNVGIGTTNPTSALTVTGSISVDSGITIGRGGGTFPENLAIGPNALFYNTTGQKNTGIGWYALQSNNGGLNNTGIGHSALFSNIGGLRNTAIGAFALSNTTGYRNTSTGNSSLLSTTIGNDNTANGDTSLYSNTTGNYNTGIGASAGYWITSGSKNTILGSYDGNENGLDIRTSNNNVVLSDGDGNIRFYANSSGNVGLGTTNPQGTLQVGTGITMYGSTGIISATTFYGNLVGSITDATNLTGGYANASQLNVSGVATISQGRIQADGSSNLRFGNLAAGSGSGRNIAIGDQVLYSLSSGQGRNIGIGELSYYDTTSGQYNIGLGIQAGQKITTGNYNVILGAYDGNSGGLDIRTLSNNVVIADGQGNIRQYINSSGNVGIKTTVVTEALTVSGIVSATSFYGTLNAGQLTGTLPAIDGSALIGVVGSGSGVIIEEDGTPVGTAGTINFGSNLDVSFASGIATVSGSIAGINTSGTSTFNQLNSTQLNVSGVSTLNSLSLGALTNLLSLNSGFSNVNKVINFGGDMAMFHLQDNTYGTRNYILTNEYDLIIGTKGETGGSTYYSELIKVSVGDDLYLPNTSNVSLGYGDNTTKLQTIGSGITVTGTTFTNQLSVSGNIISTGIITASSFVGSGSSLTNLPAGQLTGTLPALDGSALLNVTAAGTGIVIDDDNVNVGSAVTVNFGTGLDVTFSSGIATITASGGSLQSRTTVSGVTTSIANLGIGNTNITGFKSYALMKVGLSTTGWLRLYTDSTSRANDVSRSVGEDPAPGSGVIAEVVTTGISTTQIISPFVMGGNLDNPADTTIYASIKNLSGTTQSITANLTILQLEA